MHGAVAPACGHPGWLSVDSLGTVTEAWKTHAPPASRNVPAMSPGASAVSWSQIGCPSTVRNRPAATAASIRSTARASTGSGQPERQHAPECRQA